MSFSKQPNVAGSFYPKNKLVLQNAVRKLLDAASLITNLPLPKAMIVPHAGYVYSGAVAAVAYKQLLNIKVKPNRVILIGPSHFSTFAGIATINADSFVTPLGEVLVDQDIINIALRADKVTVLNNVFEQEHCLEVQLPFLQEVLWNMEYKIVPFLVSNSTYKEVANLLKLLWGGCETLVIISSDLSHYYNYATANLLDRMTSIAIEQLAIENLNDSSACGKLPIQGLLQCAIDFGLKVIKLNVKNSGDITEDKSRVVGYGAYCLV